MEGKEQHEQIRDGLEHRQDKLLHKVAGHMARADTDTELSKALKTSGPQWWREAKKTQVNLGWRTAQEILMLAVGRTDYRVQRLHGRKDNTRWLREAQDRRRWKEHEQEFTRPAAAA